METKDAMKAVINASTARTENTFANTDLIQLYDNNGNPSFKISKSDFMSAVYNYLTSSSVAANLASVLGVGNTTGNINIDGFTGLFAVSSSMASSWTSSDTLPGKNLNTLAALLNFKSSTTPILQIIYNFDDKKSYMRAKAASGRWTNWTGF